MQKQKAKGRRPRRFQSSVLLQAIPCVQAVDRVPSLLLPLPLPFALAFAIFALALAFALPFLVLLILLISRGFLLLNLLDRLLRLQ